MQHLAGDSPATTVDRPVRPAARGDPPPCLGPLAEEPWFARHVGSADARLPQRHRRRSRRPPTCRLLHDLPPGGVTAAAQYLPETATVQFTIGTSEAGHAAASSTS